MSAKDPANRLRNPYELSGDEDRDLRQLNGRPSWAVVRLFATGGIGACAVAATVLGAGSAHAAPGDGFGGEGFGGGGDFGLGSGGLIDIPQASSTPSFDAFTTGPVAWAPTVSDTSTLFSDPTVLAGTSPASTVSTVPVDVAPVVVAPFDTTSAANGSGTTPPADTSAMLWADPTVLATPPAATTSTAPPAATTSTAPAAENVPLPDSVSWSDVQVPLDAPIGVSDPAFLPVDPAGSVASGGVDATSVVVDRGSESSDLDMPSPGSVVDPAAPETLADLLATTPDGAPSTGDSGTEVPDNGAFSLSATQPGNPNPDVGSATWSDVQAPLDAPIGVSDPAFLPVDPAGSVGPDGADAGAGSAVTLSADQDSIAGADALSSAPVEGTGDTEQPAAVPVQVPTGWDDLTVPVDQTFVVGERVDPPDAPAAGNGASSDVPLMSAEPGVQSSGSDVPASPALGPIGWSATGTPTAPDTLADLLATTPGAESSAGVPVTEIPDGGALFLGGGDDVVPPPIPPAAVASDAGLSAENPNMWSKEKVPVTGWTDPPGWGTSFDVGGEGAGQSPVVDGAVSVLSPSSPIAWSDQSVPVTGIPDPEGAETPFAGADVKTPVGAVTQSTSGFEPMISSIRVGADGELADVTLGGPEQAAMVASLYTEEGRRRVQGLLSNERVVADRDELDRFVADVAGQLRGVAVNSTPLTREQADLFYPVPAPLPPSLAHLPDATRPTFQEHYDRVNTQDANKAMASRSGLESPELACWITRSCDGTSRVVPELYVGGNSYVDAGGRPVGELDLSDMADLVLLHTHPLIVGADETSDTTGLSAEDIGFMDSIKRKVPRDVNVGVASVSALEGTVVIAERGSLPDGPPPSAEKPEWSVRGPLVTRVLPSSPGSPVSGDVLIQGGDTGTVDYSQAGWMEAPGVSEQRYAAARRAAEAGLDPTELTDPPDQYGPGVLPPEVWTTEGLRSRGLVVRPPTSTVALPLPGTADRPPVDPDVGGGGALSATAPPDRETVPGGEGDPATRPGATDIATGGSSADVVFPPEGLTLEEQARLGLINLPGGWADLPPVELPDLNIPGGRPVDPDELDPNWAQRQEPFVVPESWGSPETFPGPRDEGMANNIWTFPLPPEESPAGAERPRVEPAPSPQGVVSSPEAMFASPALQPGVPFTAGDVGWSSVAVKNPLAVQRASTVTQPSGGITRSSRRAVGGYTPPAAAAEAPATTGWSSQRASQTYSLPARSTPAPVTTSFSPTLRAVTPVNWAPGVNWAVAPAPASTAVVKKPTAVTPAVTPTVRTPVVTAASTPAARSVTKPVRAPGLVSIEAERTPAAVNPVQQFTDFVGGAGNAIKKNVVDPVGGVVESLVGGPVTVTAVDGDPLTHVGTTRYQANFLGGGTAVYDRESGRKLSGNGPATLPSWQMPVPPAAVLVPLGKVTEEFLKGVGGLLQPQMP